MKKLCIMFSLVTIICGCERTLRNGKPGDPGYVAPKYSQIKVIDYEPEFIQEVDAGTCMRQAYSVVEDEEGKRYRVIGRVGHTGDTFKMDISLLNEVGL